MPHEPKKRHSRQRQGKRRASIHLATSDSSHRLTRVQAFLSQEKATVKTQATDENSK